MYYLLMSIVTFVVGVLLMTGDAQKILVFQTSLAEMAMCMMSFMMSILFFAAFRDGKKSGNLNGI